MDNNKIEIKEYEAFEKVINIKLFNDIISFIMETTNKDYYSILNELEQEHIWFKRTKNNRIQEEYGFKYFGELLERHEQRIGADIKDIRAIALGLAYSKDLITNEMIIGTQLIDFMKKIKRMSSNDIFLKGALYIYDKENNYYLFREIIYQEVKTTEEIIFAISLFNNVKDGFERLKEQLEKLIGRNKTISVMTNAGIYNWLIKSLYPIIKGNRKKGIELFKALISIPTGLIKEESKTYSTLIENKYTKEEIAFLNYRLIYYQSIPGTVRVGYSIVEEKIAIEFCESILSSINTYSDEIYELINIMLYEYNNFKIKCYGFEGMKQAIINSINIKNPKAFLKLYENLNHKLYSFDILDKKWDIVQKEFGIEEYRNLFDNYLLLNNYNSEQIKERIRKYDKLTNSSYIDSFNIYNWKRERIYSKLVEENIIDLQEYFEGYRKYKQNIDGVERKGDLQYLKAHIHEVRNRKAFLFLKYFLNLGEYNIKDTKEFGFDLGGLFKKRHCYYSSEEIDIKRDFLSIDENKELLMWLEDYIFNMKPDEYMDFVIAMLSDEFIGKILSKNELKQLYAISIKIDTKLSKNTELRKRYLSKKELDMLEKQEKEAEENRKIMEKQKREKEVIDKFNSMEKFTFKNIYECCYSYRWKDEETKTCCRITKQYLDENIQTHEFITEEIMYFNKICNLLIQEGTINIEELKNFITKYIGKGELVTCKEY